MTRKWWAVAALCGVVVAVGVFEQHVGSRDRALLFADFVSDGLDRRDQGPVFKRPTGQSFVRLFENVVVRKNAEKVEPFAFEPPSVTKLDLEFTRDSHLKGRAWVNDVDTGTKIRLRENVTFEGTAGAFKHLPRKPDIERGRLPVVLLNDMHSKQTLPPVVEYPGWGNGEISAVLNFCALPCRDNSFAAVPERGNQKKNANPGDSGGNPSWLDQRVSGFGHGFLSDNVPYLTIFLTVLGFFPLLIASAGLIVALDGRRAIYRVGGGAVAITGLCGGILVWHWAMFGADMWARGNKVFGLILGV